ncbi:MAG: efflux RND transporter periplasmic adaptor subunit [Steroidobacteraceae bacterium]|nr:efflux RND transporter periplasmic adaptor subunit [Steroidobacteraceae bacterium]
MNKPVVLLMLSLALAMTAGCGPAPSGDEPEQKAERKPLYYRNPMDPTITSPVPRKDHMGMDYIPIYEESGPAAGTGGPIELSAAMAANLGVRTAAVRRGAAGGEIRTAGTTAFDERGRVEVRVRSEGYVERLAVRAPGESVRRGQLLFELFSPKLAAAERELAAALEMQDAVLADAAAARLRALGVDAGTIERLRAGGEPGARVRYFAPAPGTVVELGVREGGMAAPGMSAMTLAPLDPLWVVAEVPERVSAGLRPGMAATVSFAALPGRRFEAKVLELLPALDPATRTRQARIELGNPDGLLAAGMVAEVAVDAGDGGQALLVPMESLIRSGGGDRIVVALDERRFEVREVVAGRESGDEVEILEGLQEGERVVVSGQFLIDSESRLRSGLARFEEPQPPPAEHDHSGHAPPAEHDHSGHAP